MKKLHFAGHETFHCRHYWLKKGLDHLWAERPFNDEAIVHLGVGKNMVSSIRFWLKAFGLTTDEDQPTELASQIFSSKTGFDPYCEDIGTIWLLHYFLVIQKRSSIYHLVFNEFRKHRVTFTKDHLQDFIERYCRTNDVYFVSSSIKKDINVFLMNYLLPQRIKKGVEDSFSGLLFELGLVHLIEKIEQDVKGKRQAWYRIENGERTDLPHEIVLFCILYQLGEGTTVSFNQLLNEEDSPGSIFALSSNGLIKKIERMIQDYPDSIVFSDDGGIKVLQFKKTMNPWSVLNRYYEQ